MLHLWEMTAQNEKKEKEMKLKERIVIQRRLIRKCDKYLREKVNAELNKKTKVSNQFTTLTTGAINEMIIT